MEMNLNIVSIDVGVRTCSMLDTCSECRRAWLTGEPSEQVPQWGASYLGHEVPMDEYEAGRSASRRWDLWKALGHDDR